MYGCDSVWRGDGQTDCFQLAPEVFTAYIDVCAAHGMVFFHNDQSWLLRHDLGGSGPWSFHADHPAYYQAKLLLGNTTTTAQYAGSKLGKQAWLTYENNNGFPTPDLEYFDSVVDPGNKTFPVLVLRIPYTYNKHHTTIYYILYKNIYMYSYIIYSTIHIALVLYILKCYALNVPLWVGTRVDAVAMA